MSYTDPSGFFFTRLLGQIWRPIVNIVGCAAGTASAQPYLCGATVAATSAASGESLTKSLRNGAVAGVSAFAFNEIGETIEALKASEQLVRATVTGIFAHGAVGAASAAIQGGDPLAGFLGAGLAKGFSIRAGDFLEGLNNLVIESIIVGTVGGTISSVTGGKFVNGATTAAIGYVYNQNRKLKEENFASAIQEAFNEAINDIFEAAKNNPTDSDILFAQYVIPAFSSNFRFINANGPKGAEAEVTASFVLSKQGDLGVDLSTVNVIFYKGAIDVYLNGSPAVKTSGYIVDLPSGVDGLKGLILHELAHLIPNLNIELNKQNVQALRSRDRERKADEFLLHVDPDFGR